MSEIEDALKQFLTQLADEIKANTPRVTGSMANSIEVRVTKKDELFGISGSILAAKHFPTLEFGRGKTKGKGGGGKTLRETILDWIKARNIVPREPKMTQEQLSYVMARKIHEEGTLLFRRGGKSGVISNVLKEDRIQSFLDVFAKKAAPVVLKNITSKIKGNGNRASR